MKKYQKS